MRLSLFKKIIIGAAVIFLVAFSVVDAISIWPRIRVLNYPSKLQQNSSKKLNRTVMIDSSGGLGSGVVLSEKDNEFFVLTNAHVVGKIIYLSLLDEEQEKKITAKELEERIRYFSDLKVSLFDGSNKKIISLPAEVLFNGPASKFFKDNGEQLWSSGFSIFDFEFAVLKIKKPPDFSLPKLKIAASSPREGDILTSFGCTGGYPLGLRCRVYKIIVQKLDDKEFINFAYQGLVPKGYSGGPMFNNKNELVAINAFGTGKRNVGVPIDFIKYVLEKSDMGWLFDKSKLSEAKPRPTSPFDKKDLAPFDVGRSRLVQALLKENKIEGDSYEVFLDAKNNQIVLFPKNKEGEPRVIKLR